MTSEAVSDTGPVRHLWEIGQQRLLTLFSRVYLPDAVKTELQQQGIWEQLDPLPEVLFQVESVSEEDIRSLLSTLAVPIQPTDASVAVLAKSVNPEVTLTDDLQLRKVLEGLELPVVGSVGLLIRGFKTGIFAKNELLTLIDRLFDGSTLYLSPVFKSHVKRLIEELSTQ
jgi:predicted nucleic acid-binding protein